MKRGRIIVAGAAAVVLLASVAVWRGVDRHDRVAGRAVPSSIAADCSRPVGPELQRFIDATPDHTTVVFPKRGCFLHEVELKVTDRVGLTFEGSGSTFKLTIQRPGEQVCRASWRIQSGSNISFRNMTAEGTHTTGFDDPRPVPIEACQHGWSIDSLQGGSFLNLRGINNAGDPISIEPDTRKGGDYCAVPPVRDVTIDNFYGFNAGRTVGISNVDGLVIRNSTFDRMYDNIIDIETDTFCEWSRNIKIVNNRFGLSHFGVLAYSGSEPLERSGNLEFAHNVMLNNPVSCFPPIYIDPALELGTAKRPNIYIHDNQLRTLGFGIFAESLVDSRIEDNTVTKDYGTGCSNPATGGRIYAVRLLTSERVNVHGNATLTGPNGLPLDGEIVFDEASQGITQTAR